MSTDDVHELVVAGIALALSYLTRYDGGAAALAAGAVVGWITYRRRDPRKRIPRALVDVTIVVAPAALAFVVWAATGWLITGDAFAQFTSEYGNAAIIAQSGGSGSSATSEALGFSAMEMLILAPLLPLLALVVIAYRARRHRLAPLAPCLMIVAVLAFQVLTYARGSTFGFLRFYMTVIVLAAILALLSVPRRAPIPVRRLGAHADIPGTLAQVAAPGSAVGIAHALVGVVVEDVDPGGAAHLCVSVARQAALVAADQAGEDRPFGVELSQVRAGAIEEPAEHGGGVVRARAVHPLARGAALAGLRLADELPTRDRPLLAPAGDRRLDPVGEGQAVRQGAGLPLSGVEVVVLELVVLTDSRHAGQHGEDQLLVARRRLEDTVERPEVEHPRVLVDHERRVEVETGERTGRQRSEVGVEIDLGAASLVDRPVGSRLVRVEPDRPPRAVVEHETGRGRLDPGTGRLGFGGRYLRRATRHSEQHDDGQGDGGHEDGNRSGPRPVGCRVRRRPRVAVDHGMGDHSRVRHGARRKPLRPRTRRGFVAMSGPSTRIA